MSSPLQWDGPALPPRRRRARVIYVTSSIGTLLLCLFLPGALTGPPPPFASCTSTQVDTLPPAQQPPGPPPAVPGPVPARPDERA